MISYFNNVRYTIFGKYFTALEIDEPKEWEDDKKELMRSETYDSIFKVLSSNLLFYGVAKTALQSAYDIDGIKADVRLERETRNEQTNDWELDYEAYFDFSEYEVDKNYVKIKLYETPFFKNIESRFKDKFELERLDDLKGGVLPPLQYSNLQFKGRDIFRETLFDNENEVVRATYSGNSFQFYDALFDFAIPLKLKYRSDDSFFAPVTPWDSSGNLEVESARIVRDFGDTRIYNGGTLFYIRSEKERTVDLQIKIKLKARFNTPNNPSATFRIFLDKVDGETFASFEENELIRVSNSGEPPEFLIPENVLKEFTVTYNTTVNLVEGDCLGLRMQPTFGAPYLNGNQWYFEFDEVTILAQENDLSITTDCKVLTYFQAFERLFQIITGKRTFQSNLLSEKWRDLLLTDGFKIRQFEDKNITISLEELYGSLSTFDDVAMIVERQTVRIESKDEVYKQQIGVDIGQVLDVSRKIIKDYHYSRIEIGYDFNGEYEEVVGLEEYNIKGEYATCIDTVENVFKSISKVRADPSGMTFAQDKQFVNFPKEDTRYDRYNFAIDAILESEGRYVMRYWETDFPNEPTGVFSPQTAFNLRLSPFNCLLRKGRTISAGLQKYPNEYLKFSSTEGNSQLVTLYPERAVILNSVLPKPYYLPEEIILKRKTSMIDFKNIINNKYKLIKFVDEDGNDGYGFIYKFVKPNGDGDYSLIRGNF